MGCSTGVLPFSRCCLATVLGLLTSLIVDPVAWVAADDGLWTQWRGPDRTGVISGTPWPQRLSDGGVRQVWRRELGPSYSGPIVTQDRIYVTETQNRETEVVTAFNRKTGEPVWSRKWQGSLTVPFFAKANGSWIRATPAFDSGHLYVAGIRDVLVCLRAEDGEEVWRFDFPTKMGSPLPQFGCVSSPLVVGDHVYVQAGAAFCKLDKRTGALIWKTLADGGGMYGSAFSSPVFATILGTDQLVVQTRQQLCGIDANNGVVLWSREIPSFRGMNILTPVIQGNRIFTSSYQNNAFMFQVDKVAGGWELNEVWKTGTRCYMSTPVWVGGYLYAHLQNQRFACIDAATGKEQWRSRPFGKYASLVAQSDRVLALDQRGELILFQASPSGFEVTDRREVSDEETWAHIAIAGSQIVIRELNAVSVYQWKNEAKASKP